MRSHTLRPLLVAALLSLLARPAQVHATTLDFDAFADGTAITNQFQSLGVVFSSDAGQPAHVFSDPAEATSSPNILVGADNFANLFITFVDPVTGLPNPASGACAVTMNVISVGVATITVTSRSLAGTPLQSFVLTHPGGPPNGLGNVDPLQFTVAGIASIDLVFTTPGPPGVDGVGIDDLSFGLGCPTPTARATWGRIKSHYR